MIEVYTDGATSNNGFDNSTGGWGFCVIKDNELVYKSNGHVEPATNNICEMTAVIKAYDYIKQNNIVDVTIYSDSAYIINCHKQGWYKKWRQNGWINSKKEPVKNKELWEEIIKIFEDENITF